MLLLYLRFVYFEQRAVSREEKHANHHLQEILDIQARDQVFFPKDV